MPLARRSNNSTESPNGNGKLDRQALAPRRLRAGCYGWVSCARERHRKASRSPSPVVAQSAQPEAVLPVVEVLPERVS